jgi:GGDEF domain-containing protein
MKSDMLFPTIHVPTQWFFLPPVTALLTVAAVSLFSSDSRAPVDDAIWGLLGLFFIALTILYGLFIHRDFTQGLFPVQLMAQGILLCPLSLRMGARMLQWVGVTLAICGAVALMVIYCRSRTTFSNRAYVPEFSSNLPSLLSILSSLPLPFAITNAEGNVVVASEVLSQLVQKPRAAVEGERIASILPLDKGKIDLAGKPWRILQAPMKQPFVEEGLRPTGEAGHYFQLEEARDVSVTLPSHAGGESNFRDPVTYLYTRPYAEKQVNGELYRIRRYQRGVSAALIRMVFQGNNPPSQEDEIFNAYCRYLRANTRETDVSCLVGPRDLLVVMPEVSLDQAEMAVGRLADFAPHVQKELAGFDGAAEIQEEVAFFNSSSGDLDFDGVWAKLDEALDTSPFASSSS